MLIANLNIELFLLSLIIYLIVEFGTNHFGVFEVGHRQIDVRDQVPRIRLIKRYHNCTFTMNLARFVHFYYPKLVVSHHNKWSILLDTLDLLDNGGHRKIMDAKSLNSVYWNIIKNG